MGNDRLKPFIAKWEVSICQRNDALITMHTKTVNDHDPDDLFLGFTGTIFTEISGEGDPDELC